MAASLLQRLTPGLPIEVASAGTLDRDGGPPLPGALTIGASWGLDLSGHRSLALTPALVIGAELILRLEQTHLHAVVDRVADQGLAFTFGELVRLLADLPQPVGGPTLVERARLRVAAANAPRAGGPSRLDDELEDVLGVLFAAAGGELRRLSFVLATLLFEAASAAILPCLE